MAQPTCSYEKEEDTNALVGHHALGNVPDDLCGFFHRELNLVEVVDDFVELRGLIVESLCSCRTYLKSVLCIPLNPAEKGEKTRGPCGLGSGMG